MLNSKKAVAVAGMLGGLALAGTGIAHATADGTPRVTCTHDAHGNVECSGHIERAWTADDGSKVVVRQSRTCDSYSKDRRYGPVLGGDGRVTQGAKMECSNSTPG